MPKRRVKVSLKAQLERAERKGHKEGREQGMADLLTVLSAADDGLIPIYSVDTNMDDRYCYAYSYDFQTRVDASMMNAAEDNNTELVPFLIKSGANANAQNEGGLTAVRTRLGHAEIAEALLAAGADVHNGYVPEESFWPIDYSAEGDQVEITRTFLKAGAYIGLYRHDEGWSPLMFAVEQGKSSSAALLIKAGSKVNAQDDNGNSVLMIASAGSREGSQELFNF